MDHSRLLELSTISYKANYPKSIKFPDVPTLTELHLNHKSRLDALKASHESQLDKVKEKFEQEVQLLRQEIAEELKQLAEQMTRDMEADQAAPTETQRQVFLQDLMKSPSEGQSMDSDKQEKLLDMQKSFAVELHVEVVPTETQAPDKSDVGGTKRQFDLADEPDEGTSKSQKD